MLKIRKLEEKDKTIYLKLMEQFYESDAVAHKVPKENFLKTFNECIKSDIYAISYILEYENKVAGYILLSKTYSNEAGGMALLIEELYVLKEFRNKGIAKKVFNFLKKEYNTCARFRLEVEKNNESAINLYKKIGFYNLKYLQMIIDFSCK